VLVDLTDFIELCRTAYRKKLASIGEFTRTILFDPKRMGLGRSEVKLYLVQHISPRRVGVSLADFDIISGSVPQNFPEYNSEPWVCELTKPAPYKFIKRQKLRAIK